jgi:YihY family inner membrane protein
MRIRIELATRRVSAVICLAVKRFLQIDGAQWAGAFAFYALFSLFPSIVLIVSIASVFIDRDQAGKEIIAYVATYVPIGSENQKYIFDTVTGVVQSRRQAGALASLMLIWASMQLFTTLICVTNRAWAIDIRSWWRIPIKSLVFLAIMISLILLGIAVPVIARIVKEWFLPVNDFSAWFYTIGSFFIPLFIVFLTLSLFYKLAPPRPTGFAEVWAAALCSTALLKAAEILFVIYLKNFAGLNAVYGAFGGIVALLLWIYLSGCIFIFGACLCAAQAETGYQAC